MKIKALSYITLVSSVSINAIAGRFPDCQPECTEDRCAHTCMHFGMPDGCMPGCHRTGPATIGHQFGCPNDPGNY